MENPFEDFFRTLRESMATQVVQQLSLPADVLGAAGAGSARFYAAVPLSSLLVYLQAAEEAEDYALCAIISSEINKRKG